MQIFDTSNLLSIMLPAFFSFTLPIIIFVILVNLITRFIRRKLHQKSYVKFNQRNIADTCSANFYWGHSLRLWKKSADKRRCLLWFLYTKRQGLCWVLGLGRWRAYLKRKEQKIELYKKYGLNLIEIDNDKFSNLDDHLPKELLKFGVSLNL